MKIKVTDMRVNPGDSGFLIDDGKTSILYDSGFGFTGFAMAEKIKKYLGSRNLDYIFLTHSHYDHALGSAYILRHYPDTTVVAGKYAAEIFKRPGAKAVMKELDSEFALKCGAGEYEFLGDELRVDMAAEDGSIIKAGDMEFRVIELPGHTKCSVGFYSEKNALLLSSETLGVYDGGTSILPSYLVSYKDTLESIDKALKLKTEFLLSPHLGILDREQTKFFLSNCRKCSENFANFFINKIQSGKSDDEIIREYKNMVLHGYIKEIYPESAVNLNTSIMIKLLKKELLNLQ